MCLDRTLVVHRVSWIISAICKNQQDIFLCGSIDPHKKMFLFGSYKIIEY